MRLVFMPRPCRLRRDSELQRQLRQLSPPSRPTTANGSFISEATLRAIERKRQEEETAAEQKRPKPLPRSWSNHPSLERPATTDTEQDAMSPRHEPATVHHGRTPSFRLLPPSQSAQARVPFSLPSQHHCHPAGKTCLGHRLPPQKDRLQRERAACRCAHRVARRQAQPPLYPVVFQNRAPAGGDPGTEPCHHS